MQLLQWYKRRNSGVERCRVYRLAPQSASAAGYLVPKPVQSPGLSTLDPRGAFVVQTEAEVYVWEVSALQRGGSEAWSAGIMAAAQPWNAGASHFHKTALLNILNSFSSCSAGRPLP